eukprot:769519_1
MICRSVCFALRSIKNPDRHHVLFTCTAWRRLSSVMSDIQSQLNQLWKLQESDRKKGTQLLLKILGNLSNNLSQSAKYGNLNFTKISARFSRCKPAFVLVLRAGFKQSNDGQRLIWTDDDDALESLSTYESN